MENLLQINQTLFSDNYENLPKQVRFKSCQENEFGCCVCGNQECKLRGNYDVDGGRYDEINAWGPIDFGRIPTMIRTKGSISLHLAQWDFYTMKPPDEGPMAIL